MLKLQLGFACLALLWQLRPVTATNVEGSISWSPACQDIEDLHPQTKVTLDNGRYKAYVRKDGRFTLFNVSPGNYLLEVLARDHVFDPLRVDVLDTPKYADVPASSTTAEASSSTPPARSGDDEDAPPLSPPPTEPIEVEVRPAPPGTPFHSPNSPHLQALPVLAYPIVLEARGRKVYVVPDQGFDPIGMFKGNPMMIMMLAAGVLIFVLPKILENMDPELVKDMTERQDKLFNMQNSLQSGDFSALLQKQDTRLKPELDAGSSPAPSASVSASVSSSALKKSTAQVGQTGAGVKKSGGSKKKR